MLPSLVRRSRAKFRQKKVKERTSFIVGSDGDVPVSISRFGIEVRIAVVGNSGILPFRLPGRPISHSRSWSCVTPSLFEMTRQKRRPQSHNQRSQQHFKIPALSYFSLPSRSSPSSFAVSSIYLSYDHRLDCWEMKKTSLLP